MVLFIIIFFSTLTLCQSEGQVSIPFEIYDNAGGQKTLYFGLDQTATDGIDIHLGESDLPPYPPVGAFDARWLLPENGFSGSLSSWRDYRYTPGFPFSGTIEHRFRYQNAGGATAMFLRWNLPSEVTGLIQDLGNGIIINVPISGSGTYQIIDFDAINKLKLIVYYNNIVSSIENEDGLPSDFILEQNYPNPFNPSTKIEFRIADFGFVSLKVYDVLGNEVATLVDEEKPAGEYEVEFSSHSGLSGISDLPSGIYFYQLRISSPELSSGQAFIKTKKMVILK